MFSVNIYIKSATHTLVAKFVLHSILPYRESMNFSNIKEKSLINSKCSTSTVSITLLLTSGSSNVSKETLTHQLSARRESPGARQKKRAKSQEGMSAVIKSWWRSNDKSYGVKDCMSAVIKSWRRSNGKSYGVNDCLLHVL